MCQPEDLTFSRKCLESDWANRGVLLWEPSGLYTDLVKEADGM